MNINKLKSKMILHGDSASILSEYLEMSKATFSRKLNGKDGEFTQGEILKIKAKYNLTSDEIDEIFFDEIVSY